MSLLAMIALTFLFFTAQANAAHAVDDTVTTAPTERIQIAVEDDASPWSNNDGTGEANDLVKEIFKAANIDIDFEVVPYARCKSMAINGQTIACFSMSESAEFKDSISFSRDPLFTCSVELYARTGLTSKYKAEKDLPRGTRLGIVKGYEYPSPLSEKIATDFYAITEVNSESQLLKMLDKNRLDVAVLNLSERKRIKTFDEIKHSKLKVKAFTKIGDMNSYIGFSNSHPKGKWALAKFNEAQKHLQKRLPNSTARKHKYSLKTKHDL